MTFAPPRQLLAIAGILVLLVWPLVFSSAYDLRVFGLAGIYAILVLGYQFIFGHAGALALTQGMFFGLAAYITAILGTRYGLPAAATLPLSIIGPVLVAAIVALPVLRLETHYFALATLGLAQIAFLVAVKWEDVTGGANGIAGVPPLVLFDVAVPNGPPMVIVIWSCVALCALLAWQSMRGIYGRAFEVMRANPLIAGAIGLDSGRMRLAAFLAGAAYAGLAGALHAHMLRVVSPEVLEFPIMVACLSMAVVGGRTRVAGAILGAILLVHLPEWLRGFESYYLIVYGAVLLAMVVAAPDGLVGLLDNFMRARGKPPPESAPAEPSIGSGSTRVSPLLELHKVSKHFGGVQALREVGFAISGGEIVGLIGPNGSGKTTLLNLISGLYPADEGRLVFAGGDIGAARPFQIARRGIGRSFQRIGLVDEMSAIDNVAVAYAGRTDRPPWFIASFSGEPLATARTRAMAQLDALGIAQHAWEPAGALPQGIRRKIEIARALALSPRLLLLDEPAAGLSPAEMDDLAARLRDLSVRGLALLVVEHNMTFLLPLADRVVCLDGGTVIAEGSPRDIRGNAAVLEAYLGTESAS